MQEKSPAFPWRLLRGVAFISLPIIFAAQWVIMIANPKLRTGTDFIAFYAVGRIAQEAGFQSAYNIALQQNIQEDTVGFSLAEEQVLLYLHVPYLLPIIAALMSKSFIASFVRWILLMLVIQSLAASLLGKTTPHIQTWQVTVYALLFFPFFISLLMGQDTALLFLGVALWYIGMIKNNDWLAATGLALTTVRPHLSLMLGLPLFFYRPKMWGLFLLLAGVLGAFSLGLIGRTGLQDYLDILKISASGAWYGMNESSMVNMIGLLWRSFPSAHAETIHALGWGGYLAGFVLTSLLWRRIEFTVESLAGMAIILVLFFAPHLFYHDLTLLFIPLMYLWSQDERLTGLPLVVSFALLILKPLHYVLPYVLYLFLAWKLARVRGAICDAALS